METREKTWKDCGSAIRNLSRQRVWKHTLNGDDELRDDGKDLAAAMGQHVLDALLGEKVVGVLGFAQTLKEHGQVVVEVKLVNVDLEKR